MAKLGIQMMALSPSEIHALLAIDREGLELLAVQLMRAKEKGLGSMEISQPTGTVHLVIHCVDPQPEPRN